MLAVWGLAPPLVHAFGVQEVPKRVKGGRVIQTDCDWAGSGAEPTPRNARRVGRLSCIKCHYIKLHKLTLKYILQQSDTPIWGI